MVVMKTHLENRSSICLRKYRIFFVFGLVLLCTQVYLAYTFLALENENQEKIGKPLISGNDISQDEEDEGLPKGTRQLKLPPDKQGGLNKPLNHNRTTRIKLDCKSLSFVPVCEVTGREAVSAITRAQSQMCKERIVNVTCLSQQNLLYPIRLQSSCPHSLGFVGIPKSLGCFKDDKISRLLPNYYTVFKTYNSPAHCAYMCLQSGFPYAGVEYSLECFCGKEEPSKANQLPDSSCNMQCPGDSKQSCGGYLAMNVFSTGIQRFKPQEARNSSLKSADKTPVKIAYLLTVNGRAVRQVKRLINILYDSSHLFYIHVDARQDYMYRELLKVEKNCKMKNIIVAKGPELRHASIWGGASLLTTFLTSARHMLLHSKSWDFLINLSESDYPIKTNARLVEFLTWNRNMNFVKSHGREVQRFLTKQGLDKTFVECEARMWRVGERKLPYGIQIDGGSDWVALSREFVEYVANPEPDDLVAGLLRVFRYTLLPAESFFHTALRNSRFCPTYVDNNLHVTNWKRKLGCKCQYKAVVDWCGCSPNDFKLEDLNRIMNTADRNLFFARKFEPVIDQRIIDRLDQWLYPERMNTSVKLTTITKGYDAYWQSLYHHEDTSPLADDALLTISNSLARLAYRRLGDLGNADDKSVHLLEITAYFKENHFAGVLVRASSDRFALESSTLMTELPEQLEALVYSRRNLSMSKSWLGKIVSLTVNTEYDQKEQMFRNFLGGIGPLSSPVFAYEFDANVIAPLNLTILWLDPVNRLAEVNQLRIEESNLIGHVKPQLSEPLAIGVWRLFLVLDSKVVAKLRFLVVPLTHWKNRPISLEKARELNRDSTTGYYLTKDTVNLWLKFLKAHLTLRQLSRASSVTLVGWQLEQWVDSLVNEFYEIVRICDAGKERTRKPRTMQRCEASDWSSLGPDPKSNIDGLH
ncbi:PREDICTED: xylosyltransferase oxt [Ceratosolen solmsi marchali]|uniref:protein xylosyltransferase n=1 Tax=Ceratosolen solmsi marchali TaxID=326594 RepID=A0AAJ7E251_9HYME|nr:PREDICTED: xylosyltransferase oxt [Ceratosolen solmsi marchali]